MEKQWADRITYVKENGYEFEAATTAWIKRIEKNGAFVENRIPSEAIVMEYVDEDAFKLFVSSQDMRMVQQLNQLLRG